MTRKEYEDLVLRAALHLGNVLNDREDDYDVSYGESEFKQKLLLDRVKQYARFVSSIEDKNDK